MGDDRMYDGERISQKDGRSCNDEGLSLNVPGTFNNVYNVEQIPSPCEPDRIVLYIAFIAFQSA